MAREAADWTGRLAVGVEGWGRAWMLGTEGIGAARFNEYGYYLYYSKLHYDILYI